MLFGPSKRSAVVRLARILFIIALIWSSLEAIFVRRALLRPPPQLLNSSGKEKIFIASIHWNNAAILRSHWNTALVSITQALGPQNVYISIQESGSWDDSKAALRELVVQLEVLGVRKRILLNETTHADEISRTPGLDEEGWIETARGRKELRRVPYLARLRNDVLRPLYELETAGEKFDKILFLNDVVFTTEDIYTLLATNQGKYAAACSLDFARPPSFYDTFALRDSEGHEALMQTWPYFRSRESRLALKAGRAVPVASCWNGMVAMDAAPFYTKPNPLAFRGIPDSLALSHLEGSECCLIHADNPLSATRGVYLNPQVRVGYSGPAYSAVNPGTAWVSTPQVLKGSWENRLLRWFTTARFKDGVVAMRVKDWRKQDPIRRAELGGFCLVDEMQVLVENGWAHV